MTRRGRCCCSSILRTSNDTTAFRRRRWVSSLSTILLSSWTLLSQPSPSTGWMAATGTGTRLFHAHAIPTRVYSYSTTSSSSPNRRNTRKEASADDNNLEDLDLVSRIRQAYDDQETDGILSLAQANPEWLLETPPRILLDASIQATQNHASRSSRAAAASIVNAWIGACCSITTLNASDNDETRKQQAAEKAQALWNTLESMLLEEEEEGELTDNLVVVPTPDVVTFCLLYHATHQRDPEFASTILERAAQISKKQAGSKRRKALVAARRRVSSSNNSNEADAEEARQRLETSLQETLENNNLRVIKETDDFLIVDKPSGVTCYHTTTTTSGKISKKSKKDGHASAKDISLEDALLHCGVHLSTLNPTCLGNVHRLDRGTSGCMIWSKTNEMHAHLVSLFFLRHVQKQYSALVSPAPADLSKEKPTKEIESPVQGHASRSRVTLLDTFELLDPEKDADGSDIANAQAATTAALLRVEPFTGRRHQVRIHCADALKAPVLLDPLYGLPVATETANDTTETGKNKKNRQKQKPPKGKAAQASPPQAKQAFCLHASSLAIPMLDVHVESPLPLWWQDKVGRLEAVSNL